MSGFLSGLKVFFTKERSFTLIFFIFVMLVLLYYSTGKMTYLDQMDVGISDNKQVNINENNIKEVGLPQVEAKQLAPTAKGYTSQNVANPSELLPSDANSQWASLNPVSQSNPQMPDLLQAGYHIGLDTIGQTMKNANLQLRSDPVIQKADIGPWNQSTIEPDLMRVPLEVGS